MSAPRKVLAVGSAGGHWTQLMRLRPAFGDVSVSYVSTLPPGREIGDAVCHVVPDANRFEKIALLRLVLALFTIIRREKPDVVVSTGAAPGYIALAIGRLFGATTIWVDSIANVDQMSMSGRLARPFADFWLTQWPHLAVPNGPRYVGSVV